MRKVLTLVLLVTAAAQANELKKAWNDFENELKQSWNNFEKDNRVISGGKALVTGYLAYASARHVYEKWSKCAKLYGKIYQPWFKVENYGRYGSIKAEILLRQGVLGGLYGYAAYLFLKQAWHDAKRALGEDKKEEQTSSLVNEWNNLGKDNRAVSGGKALLAGSFGYAALRQLFLNGSFLNRLVVGGWEKGFPVGWARNASDEWWKERYWNKEKDKIIEDLPSKVFMMGIYAGASYIAFKQAWHNAKLALGKDKKEKQIS